MKRALCKDKKHVILKKYQRNRWTQKRVKGGKNAEYEKSEETRGGASALTSYSKGFTLAEVLITLAIVGIVAAMTIPTLIQRYQERVTFTKLKQTYSLLSQAIQYATYEHGAINTWCDIKNSESYEACSIKISDRIGEYLKKSRDCLGGKYQKNDACFAGNYTNRSGELSWYLNTNRWPSFILSNGVSIAVFAQNGDASRNWWCKGSLDLPIKDFPSWSYLSNCGTFTVDINGVAGPNIDGKDLFSFRLYNDGIVPTGREGKGSGEFTTLSFEKMCVLDKLGEIGTCTAWVLENKNMDYLNCNDLSWAGKRKCSDKK